MDHSCRAERAFFSPENSHGGYQPEAGDVLFQACHRTELVDAIEGMSGAPVLHCAVVLEQSNGVWWVIEASHRVRRSPLTLWTLLGRGRGFSACRPETLARLNDWLELLRAQEGKHMTATSGKEPRLSIAPSR